MAIEILIHGQEDNGDGSPIVVAKLPGSPWGNAEKREFVIGLIEDEEIENQLVAMRDTGEPCPVVSMPYAMFERQGEGDQEHNDLIEFSTKRVDLKTLPVSVRAQIANKNIDSPRLSLAATTRGLKTKGSPPWPVDGMSPD